MKKTYYLVESGQVIPAGAKIERIEEVKTPFGVGKMSTTIPLDDETIPVLIKHGIIAEKKEKGNGILDQMEITNIYYFVNKMAKKQGWKPEKTAHFLDNIASINPAAALSMVLKTIAVELDKKYPDYIGDSEKIYTISMLNGTITEVNKAKIKNYHNFAAFRTIEDAKVACHICRDILKDLFHE